MGGIDRMVKNTAPLRLRFPARPAPPAHPAHPAHPARPAHPAVLCSACFACAVVSVVLAQPTREPTLPDLLLRAGAYVHQLEADFSAVIGDEEYEQKDVFRTPRAGGGRTRRTRAEMSFMWMPDETVWLSVRNVLRVDGATVPDSRTRLDAAIADPTSGRASQLRRLRDEGARFNIGRIGRNFSDPMLGLQVVDPGVQQRFTFMKAGI